MSLLSSAVGLRLVDSLAVILNQAYQLVRVRLAAAASPVLRLLVQRDNVLTVSRGGLKPGGPERTSMALSPKSHQVRL